MPHNNLFDRLTIIDTVQAGDLLIAFIQQNGINMNVPVSVLQAFMQDNLTFGVSAFTTQFASPSSTGFSIQINDDANDTHLILTPTATFADGTIVLPKSSVAVDKQMVLVNCTQIVTALVVDGNGATVTGEPSSLAANDFFTLKFDKATVVWYRVG